MHEHFFVESLYEEPQAWVDLVGLCFGMAVELLIGLLCDTVSGQLFRNCIWLAMYWGSSKSGFVSPLKCRDPFYR